MLKRKRDFRWIKWLLFLVLLIVAIVVVILVKNNYFGEKQENNARQSEEESRSEENKTEEKTDKDQTEEGKKSEGKAPQYEGESPNKSENLTGLVTYADVVNEELVIRVNIDQFLQSGSCNLTMSRNGATYYSQSVGIQESVTTSTCDGYKIPVSELSKGDFQVEIDLESDGKSGKIMGRVRI